MKLRGRRVRILTWVLACLIGVLGISTSGIFLAEKIITGSRPDEVIGFCEEVDCAMLDAKIAEEEAAKKAAASGVIYLTFDDGPSEYTARLLDVLSQYDIKATFFVTGRGPDELILRMFNEGHAIGVHSWSHNYSHIYANVENFWADILAVQARIKSITGEEAKLLRFPGGSSNTVSRKYDGGAKIMSFLARDALARGLYYFDWNVDSKDAGGAKNAEEVLANVTGAINHPGDFVVLQHDTKDYSVAAVEGIIQYGLANDFLFDKLSPESYAARHGVNN
ncbi:MAG: polysaccharide deacetylase family protein [Candidatus Saccharibacteria bacterium]|nr:polysaccharide deacetylase family protein [Candidatus Saccharibacteria bacterium]